MRSKRFNHYTDVFCEMFTGWRCPSDEVEYFASLGKGVLRLDFLTGENRFDGIALPRSLYIAEEITAWLQAHLQKNNLDLAYIEEVSLTVDITPLEQDGRKNSRTRKVIKLDSSMMAVIRTDEAEYKREKRTIAEFHFVLPKSGLI